MADCRPFPARSSLGDPHGAGPSLSLVMDLPGGDHLSDFPARVDLASPGSADPLPHPESVVSLAMEAESIFTAAGIQHCERSL